MNFIILKIDSTVVEKRRLVIAIIIVSIIGMILPIISLSFLRLHILWYCQSSHHIFKWSDIISLEWVLLLWLHRYIEAWHTKACWVIKIFIKSTITHIKILVCWEKIKLICLFSNFRKIILLSACTRTRLGEGISSTLILLSFYDFEYWFRFRLKFLIRIIDKSRIQLLKLFKFDESSLISVSFFC